MTDRVRRVRPVTVKLEGRLANAMNRRRAKTTGEEVPEDDKIVQYFGEDDDTPAMMLLKSSPPATRTHRGGESLHVSDLINKCVRRIVLSERLSIRPPTEKIVEGQGITFAIGDAVHAYITNRFIKGHPTKVYAEWGCACGRTKKTGMFSKISKAVCDQCSTPLTKHHEVAFEHPDYPLTGSPDIVLRMDDHGAYFLVELKSISAAQFKELVRPQPDHVIQIVFYWHILKANGWPLVDKVSILYANKEFSFKLPYKEFLIDPQEPGLLDPYMEDLKAVQDARDGGPLPARTFCQSIDSAEAKKCPVCVACFGVDE